MSNQAVLEQNIYCLMVGGLIALMLWWTISLIVKMVKEKQQKKQAEKERRIAEHTKLIQTLRSIPLGYWVFTTTKTDEFIFSTYFDGHWYHVTGSGMIRWTESTQYDLRTIEIEIDANPVEYFEEPTSENNRSDIKDLYLWLIDNIKSTQNPEAFTQEARLLL